MVNIVSMKYKVREMQNDNKVFKSNYNYIRSVAHQNLSKRNASIFGFLTLFRF